MLSLKAVVSFLSHVTKQKRMTILSREKRSVISHLSYTHYYTHTKHVVFLFYGHVIWDFFSFSSLCLSTRQKKQCCKSFPRLGLLEEEQKVIDRNRVWRTHEGFHREKERDWLQKPRGLISFLKPAFCSVGRRTRSSSMSSRFFPIFVSWITGTCKKPWNRKEKIS